MQRLPIFTSWLPILFSILTALAAGTHLANTPGQWPQMDDQGPASSLDEPAILAQPPALIVRAIDTPLRYHPLEGNQPSTGILPYPDVNPRHWQAAPAAPDAYHLIWLEQNNRLRCALIRTDGVTMRGPIELAANARPDFVVLPGAQDDVLVIWINSRTASLSAVTIDSAGRPGPISNFADERLTHIAAARDPDGMVYLAWLTSPAPDQWTLTYRASSPNPLELDTPTTLYSFTLAPGESIITLQMGLDDTHLYLFWGTTTAAQPDREHVQMITFPLAFPGDRILSDLRLPEDSHPAALRWPRPAPGQTSTLPLAVALRTPDGWRPAVVHFQHGEQLDFQVIAPLPADAGPPALIRSGSALYAAWTGLDGLTSHLYTARTDGDNSAATHNAYAHPLLRTLAGALIGILLGLVWLILPLIAVIIAPANAWTLPLSLALYSTVKLLWPADLFAQLPPLLAALEPYASARSLVESAVLLTGLCAAGAYFLAARRSRPMWQTSLVYPLVDAVLTWLLFGANVFH